MRGGAVKIASRAIVFVLRVAGVVVMARLVSPDDYGLYLMATSFTLLLTMFDDIGLSRATVQRQKINHEQISTLFWVNAGVGVLLFLLAVAAAPVLGWFYGEPRLIPVTMAMGIPFVLSGLSVQHGALLQRQMRFMTLETIALIAQLAGAAVMYTSAWLGAAYWALVLNIIVMRLVGAVLTWGVSGWRPGLPRRGTGVRGMIVFGGHLSGSNSSITSIATSTTSSSGSTGVRRFWGSTRRPGLLKQPLSQIGMPTSSIIVPALSRLQDEPLRYRAYFIKAMRAVVFLTMPMVIFTCVEARELILILLGSRWLPVVPIFMALAPASLFGVSNVFSGWLYQSLGRVDRMFKSGTAMLGVMIVAFVAGLPWGGLGVAAAYSIAWGLLVLPMMAYAVRGTPLTLADMGAAVWRQSSSPRRAEPRRCGLRARCRCRGPWRRAAPRTASFSPGYAGAWAVFSEAASTSSPSRAPL